MKIYFKNNSYGLFPDYKHHLSMRQKKKKGKKYNHTRQIASVRILTDMLLPVTAVCDGMHTQMSVNVTLPSASPGSRAKAAYVPGPCFWDSLGSNPLVLDGYSAALAIHEHNLWNMKQTVSPQSKNGGPGHSRGFLRASTWDPHLLWFTSLSFLTYLL